MKIFIYNNHLIKDQDIVFYVPTQNNKPQKTRTIDNNSNPNWNSSHPLFVNYDPQSPSPFPKITLELWDANVFSKDEKVYLFLININI